MKNKGVLPVSHYGSNLPKQHSTTLHSSRLRRTGASQFNHGDVCNLYTRSHDSVCLENSALFCCTGTCIQESPNFTSGAQTRGMALGAIRAQTFFTHLITWSTTCFAILGGGNRLARHWIGGGCHRWEFKDATAFWADCCIRIMN